MSNIEELTRAKEKLEAQINSEQKKAAAERAAKLATENKIKSDAEQATLVNIRIRNVMGMYNELRPLLGKELTVEKLLLFMLADVVTRPDMRNGDTTSDAFIALRHQAELVGKVEV